MMLVQKMNKLFLDEMKELLEREKIAQKERREIHDSVIRKVKSEKKDGGGNGKISKG